MTIRLPEQNVAIDYLLVYLLAAISGMPFFNGDIPMIGVFGFAFLMFLLRREGFHRYFFFILFSFLILVCLHSLRFYYFPRNTYIGLIVKISVGFFVLALVKEKFTKYFVDIIVFFSIVSFFFFIPLFISSGFEPIFSAIGVTAPFEPGSVKSLIVYQLNLDRPGGLYRNCGPFWEPAAFGGYLLIALMFNLANTNSLKDRKSVILIITLISTLSTTVFLLLAVLIFFYFFLNQTILVKLITVPLMVVAFVYAYNALPFIGEKIDEEISRGDMKDMMTDSDEVGHTRLSSAIWDYYDFIKYPILGRGIFEQTFYNPTDVKTRHNGLTKHIAQWGIVGSLIYFTAMFMSFRRLVKYSDLHPFISVVFFILILGMGVAEGYFDKPFFWGLIFLSPYVARLYYEEEEVFDDQTTVSYA
jgi:hypothetical protein